MKANLRSIGRHARARCALALLAGAIAVSAQATERSEAALAREASAELDAASAEPPAPLLAFAAKNLPPGQVLPVGTPPGSLGVRGFGFSLAFNGQFAVIGAPTESPSQGAPTHGVAYVFQRTSAGWRFMQRLTPTGTTAGDSGTDNFGFSVDVYSDRNGSQIVVGAPGDDDDATGAVDSGAVYVYDLRRVGVGGPLLGWVARKLVASTAHPALTAGARFGTAVRTENQLVVAGAPFALPGGQSTSPGVVIATRCTPGATGGCVAGALVPNTDGVPGERFGAALALSRQFLVVGAPSRPLGAIANAGAAVVYANQGGVFRFEATLRAPDAAANDNFGAQLALFRNEVLVGVASDDLPGPRGTELPNAGSARLFSRQATAPVWSQREVFTAAQPETGASFGIAVGLHARRAVIGSLRRSGGTTGGAAILEFERGRWVQRDELFDTGGEPTEFYGFAVAAGPGGVFVGAPLDNGGAGQAFWYPLGAAAITRRLNPDPTPAGDRYGASTAILGNFVLIGVPDQDYIILRGNPPLPIPITNGGEVRVLAKNLVVGAQGLNQIAQIRMPSSDAVSNARFGTRVALSRNGDVLAVSAPGATAGSVANAGAVYIYERVGLTSYTQVARLLSPAPQAGSGFGDALDITPNGNVVLVGAPEQNGGRGMVYAFRRGPPIGKAAVAQLKGGAPFDAGSGVPPPGGGTIGDKWGSAVATDGANAVVGSPGANGGDGSINVLDGDGSGGYQAGPTIAAPPDAVSGDQQGFGTAVDVDGGIVAVGAPNTDVPPAPEQSGNQSDVGAAYAFPVSPDPPVGAPSAGAAVELPPPAGAAGDKWGSAVGAAGGTVLVGAPGVDVPTDTGTSVDQGAGASYACSGETGPDGECPLNALLFGSGAGTGEAVGTAVSIDENQNLVLGAPLADEGANSDAGAVYTAEQVFEPDTLLADSFD